MSASPYNPVYTCRRFKSIGYFDYSADFSKATSTIWVSFFPHDESAWQPLPYQVADAHHNRRKAEKLIAEYFS